MTDHDRPARTPTAAPGDDVRSEHHDDDVPRTGEVRRAEAVPLSPKLKTSAAAVFSLVFGLSALLCAIAILLSPLAVVFGLIGIILGIVGLKMAKQIHVTGKGVAIGGLILSVLGLLLGIGVIAGISTFLTDEANVQALEDRVNGLIEDAPTELPDTPLTD